MTDTYRVYITVAYPDITGAGKTIQRLVFRTNRDVVATSQEQAIHSPVFKPEGTMGWGRKPFHAIWRAKNYTHTHLVVPKPGTEHCKECGWPDGEAGNFFCQVCQDRLPDQPPIQGMKRVKLAKGQTERTSKPRAKKAEVKMDPAEVQAQLGDLFAEFE